MVEVETGAGGPTATPQTDRQGNFEGCPGVEPAAFCSRERPVAHRPATAPLPCASSRIHYIIRPYSQQIVVPVIVAIVVLDARLCWHAWMMKSSVRRSASIDKELDDSGSNQYLYVYIRKYRHDMNNVCIFLAVIQ